MRSTARASSPATPFSAEPPDRTVYLHFDGNGDGASWPVADYSEQGIFTPSQETELASRFTLSPALVSKLSLYVGNTLDAESLMNLSRVSCNKAVRQAEEALRRAVRHARQDARRRNTLVEVLLACSTQFAQTPADVAVLSHAQALARDPGSSLESLLEAADAVRAHPGAAALLAPADRRKLWDGRREHIVRSCCYVWMDAGKRLTSARDKGRLYGPLFELIWAVMRMVLSERDYPSDETIQKDIAKFRKLIKRRPEMLDGR